MQIASIRIRKVLFHGPMPRFAFILLLFLFAVGCRTAAHGPQHTVIVHQPKAPKQFWNKTAQLFQPLMPDFDRHHVETEEQLASHRPHTDILPVSYTAHSIYRPDAFLGLPNLTMQTEPPAQTEPLDYAADPVYAVSPLQIQADDSEALQSLLREIAIMPSERWNVNEAKLNDLLTSFRDEIMDSDFEDEYLALLRRRVLPEIAPTRTTPSPPDIPSTTAPLPEAEFARTQHPVRRQHADRAIDWATDEDYDYDNEPIIAQRQTNTMRPAAQDYPQLVQLPQASSPRASSGVAQVAYQHQVHAPTTPHTGFGAGDWQTPARQAVEQLRYAIEHTPTGRSISNEMRLRLMETLLGNKTEAARPMQSANETVNNFMGNQVLGFAALLDDTAQDSRSKNIAAAFRFNEGLMDLQNICPIRLKNVTFVKDWFGYGQFVPHSNEFHPGERFRVYAEIENPTVNRTDMFETCVLISYEIRDDRAAVIVKQDGGEPSIERSLTRKRDYCLEITGLLPASLPPGQYQLRVNITDLNDRSMQYAQESLDFKIVPTLPE